MAMKLSDLTSHAGEWLRGSGPMSEVVISSRIRLARNIAGYPFLARCSRAQRTTLEHKIDDALEAKLDYCFHPRFGYLTACPTNVGTGIRVSVMLHLPALKLTGEIEKVFRAAKDMRLAVRGLYGEGTEATGDFYQISNQ